MEMIIIDQLSALAHPRRLDLFRLLMRRYPDRVPAGEIARILELKANTTSTYLASLRQAGLIVQERDGPSILYQANVAAMRGLIEHLSDDCCQGRPDVCLSPPSTKPLVPSTDKPLNVLFLCSANTARSIMSEALLRELGAGRFRAYSAGTDPVQTPHSEALRILGAEGHNLAGLHSKSLHGFAPSEAPVMDIVITVCDNAANTQRSILNGQPLSAHWGLPDPVARQLADPTATAFEDTYATLRQRVGQLVQLPFDQMSRLSLQHRLDDIGRSTSTPLYHASSPPI